jgi:hypothetical protein
MIKNVCLLVTPTIAVEDNLLKTTDVPSTGSIMNKNNDQEVRQ